MSTFNINVKGATELYARLGAAAAKLQKVIDQELKDGAEAIAAEAKQRAPGDQGILRNEISASRISALRYSVSSNAIYSAYVEFGTRSLVQVPAGLEEYAAQFKGGGFSSLSAKEAIFNWCKRKGIPKKAWYAVYLKVMIVGTKPQPFFFPAANRIKPIIIDRVERAIKSAI